MSLVILYWVLVAVMIVGVIGALVPAIPGIGLILGAMLVWGLASQFAGMGVSLVVTVVILLLSIGVDFLATVWGAKRVGASDWSQIGAMVGLFAGIFGFLPALPFGGPIIGLFLGPVVGAFVGEYAYRKEWKTQRRFQQSLKVCVGIIVGTLFGNIAKALLALTAVIIFIYNTLPHLPN